MVRTWQFLDKQANPRIQETWKIEKSESNWRELREQILSYSNPRHDSRHSRQQLGSKIRKTRDLAIRFLGLTCKWKT